MGGAFDDRDQSCGTSPAVAAAALLLAVLMSLKLWHSDAPAVVCLRYAVSTAAVLLLVAMMEKKHSVSCDFAAGGEDGLGEDLIVFTAASILSVHHD